MQIFPPSSASKTCCSRPLPLNGPTRPIRFRASGLVASTADAYYPVLVAVAAGEVVGWCSFGDFRDTTRWPGYQYTVEHTIHVREDNRGDGVGRSLMTVLLERAQSLGKHVMVGAVTAENEASIRFHERLGFVEVARMPQVGAKFGRWLDLVLLQKRMDEGNLLLKGGSPPSRWVCCEPSALSGTDWRCGSGCPPPLRACCSGDSDPSAEQWASVQVGLHGRSSPFLTDDPVLGAEEIGRWRVGPRLQRCHLVVGGLGHEQPDRRERPCQDVTFAVIEHESCGGLGAVGFAGIVQPFVMQQAVVEDLIGRRSTDVGEARTDEHEVIDRTERRHDGDDDPRTRGPDEDHTFVVLQDRAMWVAHSSAVVPSKSRGSKSTATHRAPDRDNRSRTRSQPPGPWVHPWTNATAGWSLAMWKCYRCPHFGPSRGGSRSLPRCPSSSTVQPSDSSGHSLSRSQSDEDDGKHRRQAADDERDESQTIGALACLSGFPAGLVPQNESGGAKRIAHNNVRRR